MTKKLTNSWPILGVVTIALITGAILISPRRNMTSTQSHPSYSLKLTSGEAYAANNPVALRFSIKDQDGKVLKDFDTVHEKKLHLIVVRKDRTNFQHVHPTLDPNSGMFMLDAFSFPTDGPYRVFADFTASNAQKDAQGVKLTATPYQDVQAGELSKYTQRSEIADKLNSSANGLDTSIFFPPLDDAPGAPNRSFSAGQDSSIAIEVNKDKQSYKSLQKYLGALGHMVVLGPNLEYIHAHATSEDVANQTGLVTFAVNFPEAGQYRLFLQTQSNNQVNTTDYTVTVRPNPDGTVKAKSAPAMDHMSH